MYVGAFRFKKIIKYDVDLSINTRSFENYANVIHWMLLLKSYDNPHKYFQIIHIKATIQLQHI